MGYKRLYYLQFSTFRVIYRIAKKEGDEEMELIKIEPAIFEQRRLRVCAYARVSTDGLKQEDSLENQRITYEQIIKNNPDYDFVDVYTDQGISGTNENRPEFQRMLNDCREGKIDLIITKSISRFARNTITVIKYARELKELGIGIIFEENNINTLSADGELMLTVLASFAQEESRSMSENNKWTIKKKFERGEGMINTTRFMGYDKDENGELIINEQEAKIVRRIYDMYISGMGCHRIAKKLNEEGIATVTGAQWYSGTIKEMLRNEKYKGDFHIQKYFTPETRMRRSVKNNGEVESIYISENHQGIVTEEEWQQAQEMLEYNKKNRNIQSGSKYVKRYSMSGMLICPYCGKSLLRRTVYNKKIEWLCSTYIQNGKKACKGIRVKDAELAGLSFSEPMVIEEVIKNGKKYYSYTSKKAYDNGERAADRSKEEGGSILQSVNRSRRTTIEL